MSRAVQIAILCLAISGIRGNEAPVVCCIAATPSPNTCPAVTTTTTTTTQAPFVCPYLTTTTPQPTTQPATDPAPTTPSPSSSTPIARNPDPNPAEAKPNYMVVPSNPGMPMPWYPYPMFGNYMPILEDPTTGQRYYVMPNPNRRTNKYTQTFNIFSPDTNPGYYAVPSSTEAPKDGANQNSTSTAAPVANS